VVIDFPSVLGSPTDGQNGNISDKEIEKEILRSVIIETFSGETGTRKSPSLKQIGRLKNIKKKKNLGKFAKQMLRKKERK
jgi:hypothetical protein